ERRRWNDAIAAANANDSAGLLTAENDARVRDWLAQRGPGAAWTPLDVETYLSAEGATLTREADGSIVSSERRPDKDTYTITGTTPLATITAVRLNVIALDALPMKGPGRNDNGNFHLSEVTLRLFDPGAASPIDLKVRRATADFNQTDWGIDRAVDGKSDTAWGIHPAEGASHYAVFELAEPLTLNPGARLAISLAQLHGTGHIIGSFSIAMTGDPAERAHALPAAAELALSIGESERTREQQTAIAAAAMRYIAEDALAKLPPQAAVFAAAKRVGLVAGEANAKTVALDAPKPVHLMERGELDKPRAEIPPGALSALTHLPARFALRNPEDEGERRAALADWIAHPGNVLTWRSVVNRVWHYHFGRGICDTPSDFGEMGGAPSHPELIDWLAVWFRDDAKGSLKQLHRLIVTSQTYRQSSQFRANAAAIDGDNRFLWRQNRQRLDADAYRDFARAASGRLDLAMGGPGVQQFARGAAIQLTPALDYAAYDWNVDSARRRSVYRYVWRGIPDPFMDALDFPDLGLLSPVRG
ncbi:MAG: DUF1553 domain-containing protein, partial [Candidatus Hydrogenedentes bacterium]|nr:DUF1553 domain-containing protein [Candidatus Hydrogenedentota bacterium]